MLQDPHQPFVLQEMERGGDVAARPLHDLLEQLQQVRWLTCESVVAGQATGKGRPVARCYRISDLGLREAARALDRYERT
jgi:hypothetical protein